MELTSQIADLEQELSKVVQGEGSATAIVGLNNIHDKLNPIYDNLKNSLDRRVVLHELPARYEMEVSSTEEMELSEKCLLSLGSFKEKWSLLETKYSIIQDDIYNETLDSLTEFDSTLSARNGSVYSEWLSQMDSEIRVSDSDLEHQISIPALKDNAEKYREELQKYQIFRTEIHITTHVIGQLNNRSRNLVKFKGSMVFDQPESVVRLFKYLRQTGNNARAPISLLTPEVLKWMSDQGEDQYFYVSDKRIGSGR